MYCMHCGNKVNETNNFCDSCGNKIEKKKDKKENKDEIVYIEEKPIKPIIDSTQIVGLTLLIITITIISIITIAYITEKYDTLNNKYPTNLDKNKY